MIFLLLTALVLIVLVLIQRGKGGGLSGAFGGMGGQSAFGTKAGDLFTKITIGVATFWILLCIVSVRVLGIGGGGPLSQNLGKKQRSRRRRPPRVPGKQPAAGQTRGPRRRPQRRRRRPAKRSRVRGQGSGEPASGTACEAASDTTVFSRLKRRPDPHNCHNLRSLFPDP